MAKQGIKHPKKTLTKKRSEQATVPEIKRKAKHGSENINPIIEGTASQLQQTFCKASSLNERPISEAYKVIDNDLARDNLENDIPEADLQEL